MQMAIKTKLLAQSNRIGTRGIGQHDSQAGQAGQAMRHTAVSGTELFQAIKLMCIRQKVVGIGFVMSHHAQQGGAIL